MTVTDSPIFLERKSPGPEGSLGLALEPAILGLGSSLPEHSYDQAAVATHLSQDLDASKARRLRAAFRGSRVTSRGSVLPDFDPASVPQLFRGGVPSTAERMEVFEEHAPRVAELAARRALEASGVGRELITHLLFVTCTGFVAPGPDQELIERIGLPLSIRRVQIGFQGCSAGLVGLRTAAEIVRGDPEVRVLVVSVELPSLHFQADIGEEDLRGHALFADGAGAAVVGAPGENATGNGAVILLGPGRSLLLPIAKDDMTWKIDDTGFRMQLTSRVPEALSTALPGFVEGFHVGLSSTESCASIRHWAIHPGGPVILDRVARVLGLPATSLAPSREVLSEHGNMSSATIFFVLERIAREGLSGLGIAMAFGPGLAAEGLAFRVSDTP